MSLFFFLITTTFLCKKKGEHTPVCCLTLNFRGNITSIRFPGDSNGEESTCNVGDLGSMPGLGRSPGGGDGNPIQYSCLENPHEQRSLAGNSPWSHKELDTTEWLSTRHIHYVRMLLHGRLGGQQNMVTCLVFKEK